MAILIRAEGKPSKVEPKKGKSFTLKELQTFVGGYIEILGLDDDFVFVVDEEGKLKEKPVNIGATWLTGGMLGPIVGDVLFCHRNEVK